MKGLFCFFLFFQANAVAECVIVWAFFERPMKQNHLVWLRGRTSVLSLAPVLQPRLFRINPKRNHSKIYITSPVDVLDGAPQGWEICGVLAQPLHNSRSILSRVFVYVNLCVHTYTLPLHWYMHSGSWCFFQPDCQMDLFWFITLWC